jgi:HAD superfamily hydrolase (TIGR01484 family)
VLRWLAMKLFATDLDGTLLDKNDGIHPRDLAAIARARESGVIVTIATGRLTSRTHPIARQLGLDAPIVCADGGVLACAKTEQVLSRHALPVELVETALDLFHAEGLSSFVFTHDAIHSCERGRAHHGYVRGWAHAITAHEELRSAPAWRADEEAAIMALGMGERGAVTRVEGLLAPLLPQLELMAFDVADARVLRIMARGVSKGTALLELAGRLGVAREDLAVVGDWYNDLSMFQVAGRSYAMPHAPADVKAAAHCVLDEAAPRRGAIADALDLWLAAT